MHRRAVRRPPGSEPRPNVSRDAPITSDSGHAPRPGRQAAGGGPEYLMAVLAARGSGTPGGLSPGSAPATFGRRSLDPPAARDMESPPRATIAVLLRSEACSDLCRGVVEEAGGTPRTGEDVAELAPLHDACGVVLAVAG